MKITLEESEHTRNLRRQGIVWHSLPYIGIALVVGWFAVMGYLGTTMESFEDNCGFPEPSIGDTLQINSNIPREFIVRSVKPDDWHQNYLVRGIMKDIDTGEMVVPCRSLQPLEGVD